MTIYTKRGDGGDTHLFGGKKVSKGNLRIEALGNIDELNSSIGVVRSFLPDEPNLDTIDDFLKDLQGTLHELGAEISRSEDCILEESRVGDLEKIIDNLELELPKLKTFILPTGTRATSLLQLSRSICRRAERSIALLSKKEEVNSEIIRFLNRLSDLLFVLARYVNKVENGDEEAWSH